MEWRGEAWDGHQWNCKKCDFGTLSDFEMFKHILFTHHWMTGH